MVIQKTDAKWRYGYACINMELAEEGWVTGRGIQFKTFAEEGLGRCGEVAHSNLVALQKVLEWNKTQGIQIYRMTSGLFPWATEYDITQLPNWSDLEPLLNAIAKFIRENKLRVSFHPGPYNNLGSPDPKVIKNTLKDLEMHSQIMDLLEQPQDHRAKINIHLGGAYGDKEAAMQRFERNFPRCSEGLRSRLTLENDDRESLYSVGDLNKIYQATGVPIVFDGHHWQVGAKSGTYEEDLMTAYKTWGDVIPTLHWSNSRRKWEDPEAKDNAHSDWYYESMSLPNLPCDIVLESKMKERALAKYLKDINS